MKSMLWVWAICAGCTTEVPIPYQAAVGVVASGRPTIHANACIDASFLDCKDSNAPLTVTHDGQTVPLVYGGFLFPEHQADLPAGDPASEFVFARGAAHARVVLPPAFELLAPSGALTPRDRLELSWEPGNSPMRWKYSYVCPDISGGSVGDGVVDSGTLSIDLGRISNEIGHTGSCEIELELERIDDGTIDRNFGADGVTGIQRRTHSFTLSR